jgi:hypothetical protein
VPTQWCALRVVLNEVVVVNHQARTQRCEQSCRDATANLYDGDPRGLLLMLLEELVDAPA